MTTLNNKPSDVRFDADTRANLMGLRTTLKIHRKQLRVATDPELHRILLKAIAVTQFDIRAIEISGEKRR